MVCSNISKTAEELLRRDVINQQTSRSTVMNVMKEEEEGTMTNLVVTEKLFLQEGLYRYWQTVHSQIAQSSYVLDIAYLKDSNVFQLVELSPFTPCTGGALFYWQYDREI